jgi:hypothetical protein
MKRYILIVSALATLACNRVTELEPVLPVEPAPTGSVRVHFRADQPDTRAQFGEPEDGTYPTLWTANDSEVKISLNFGSAIPAELTPAEDLHSATFDAEIDFTGIEGPYTFYSVSPSSAAYALSPSREAWKVSIPCEQTPTAGSVDEAGIIIAASSIPFTVAPAETSIVDLHFDHLTAYGRLSFSNLALNGATVQSVELTATTPIVGDWYWKCGEGHNLIDYGASSTLTIHTSRTEGIWFACAPVDMSEQMMVVTVYTTAGYFEKMIEFPANHKFESGRAAVFTVDMAGIEPTESSSGSGVFTLVTDASTLAAGDEVLIVYKEGSKAMGAKNSSRDYREPVNVTFTDGTIDSPGSARVLTLCSSTGGTWAFKDGDVYLASTNSGNNLTNVSSISDNARWSVSINTSGIATIQAQAGSSKNLMYNTGSPRFSCYTGGTNQIKSVSIYRRANAVATADPMLERSDYGCYLSSGVERTLTPGTDQVTRAYNAQNVLTYSIIEPGSVEELEISGYRKGLVKGDDVTVGVHWRKKLTTVLDQSYSMHVIKEEGPKVWLSDGTGNGFIIKK